MHAMGSPGVPDTDTSAALAAGSPRSSLGLGPTSF